MPSILPHGMAQLLAGRPVRPKSPNLALWGTATVQLGVSPRAWVGNAGGARGSVLKIAGGMVWLQQRLGIATQAWPQEIGWA